MGSLPDARDVFCRFSGRPASYYSLAGTNDYQVRGISESQRTIEQCFDARIACVTIDLMP